MPENVIKFDQNFDVEVRKRGMRVHSVAKVIRQANWPL